MGNKFKGAMIRKAVQSLKVFPRRVSSGEEAMKLKGVGKSIAKKIDDIIETGAMQRYLRSH